MALDNTHLQQINDALAKLKEADAEIALAKRAGLHELPNGQKLVDLEKQVTDQKATLLKIKNTYFPNAA